MAEISPFFDKWLARLSGAYAFWPLLPASIMSGAVAYFSTSVAWINQLGAFGWAATSVISFVLLSAGFSLIGWGRLSWGMAAATRKWRDQVDGVNPLDTEFHKKRIKIQDLAHPEIGRVFKKRFVDCELMGPATVSLLRCKVGAAFINCDLIVTKGDVFVYNSVTIIDSEFVGGSIFGATIYIHPDQVASMEQIKPYYISATGNPEIDARPPKAPRNS